MNRKIIAWTVTLALVYPLLSRASEKRAQPQIWAAISVSDPLFREGWAKELMIHFTLVNDGTEVVKPKVESSKIIVNGEELEDSEFIFSNGLRGNNWDSIPPGEALIFGKGLGDYFKKPGIYTVVWRGENFESQPITFRVMASKNRKE